jgi:hypothetical protein
MSERPNLLLARGTNGSEILWAANYREQAVRSFISEIHPIELHNAAYVAAGVAESTPEIISQSAAALAQVRRDIIAGEGPTVVGRVHFSRTIDADDAALCARIHIFAGRTGTAVSRAEADALFAIDAAGSERRDGGHFDDLLARGVVHHLMSAGGADVPSREIAFAPEDPLVAWASAIDPDAELRAWLAARLGGMKSYSRAARAIAATVPVMSLLKPQSEQSVSVLFDIAA